MIEVKIDEAIRKDPKLRPLIERASTSLEEEIGTSKYSVSAEWTLEKSGQELPMIGLKISDGVDSASDRFEPAFLERVPDSSLRIRFIRLWGDLLQEKSHRQMKHLNLIVQGLE